MRSLPHLLPLLAAALCAAAPAQKQDQAELQRLRTQKLQLPVFGKAPWTFDLDAAKAAAAKTGKPIFAYFTRSYAH